MKNIPHNQTSLFEKPLPIKLDQLHSEDSFFDKTMAQLDELSKMGDAMNKMLTNMLDDLQKDWTEDEKMMVKNPKKYHKKQKLKELELNKETEMAKELSTEVLEVLKNCTVDGNIVKLPDGQLDRKTYTDVKNKLELIGGKWKGGKIMGFVFDEDPTELLEQIANGENRNLKKEFQFFATPDVLCDRLVELADINETHDILEPSAGQGAIVRAIHRKIFDVYPVYAYELMPINERFLNKIGGLRMLGKDFLTECDSVFDRIIANPPFSKNQDIEHVQKMYSCLKEGGRLVSVMSRHWMNSSNKKEVNFRNWLDEVGAEIQDVDAGEFSESGTKIATCIVIIDKA